MSVITFNECANDALFQRILLISDRIQLMSRRHKRRIKLRGEAYECGCTRTRKRLIYVPKLNATFVIKLSFGYVVCVSWTQGNQLFKTSESLLFFLKSEQELENMLLLNSRQIVKRDFSEIREEKKAVSSAVYEAKQFLKKIAPDSVVMLSSHVDLKCLKVGIEEHSQKLVPIKGKQGYQFITFYSYSL